MQNHDLLISILIITYNYEKELLRALNAIQKQTYQNYEIIIVDDCSTDNTIDTTNTFIQNNPQMNIKLICHTQNQGIVSARNTALQHATGDYLYIHDADDWMEPNCLEELATVASKTNADRVIGEFRDVTPSGKILQVRDIAMPSSKWFHMMHDACLYKHSIIQENNIQYIDGVWDDIGFNFQFSIYSKHIEYIQKTLFNYYVNTNSTSGAKSLANKAVDITKFNNLLKLFLQNKDLLTKQDWTLAEYYLIKYYYFSILHEGRYAQLGGLLKRYDLLHSSIQKHLPNYICNTNIHFSQMNYDRNYGKKVTFLLIQIEKLHLMKPLLVVYHFISKLTFIPV